MALYLTCSFFAINGIWERIQAFLQIDVIYYHVWCSTEWITVYREVKSVQIRMRDYWSVWKQFVLHGVMQDGMLPPALIQSWKRCAALGLDPYGDTAREEMTEPVSSSISRQLHTLVRPVMEDMHQFIEGSACVVVFADDEVRIVDCFGDADMRVELEHLGLRIVARRSSGFKCASLSPARIFSHSS